MFINKNVRFNNSKTRTAMNAKISIHVICVEAIIYLSLRNLHDCNFKENEYGISTYGKLFLVLPYIAAEYRRILQ